ncbi:MAG TPA: 4a-hydroxytetrahydrobiopterin dehydratase [Acidimicrobiales bacterium]|nr:4a-hydroxytetrahydrobiopterin dehydratase [Acidimicrobiales bacterium]
MDILDDAAVDEAIAGSALRWERQGRELCKVVTGRNFADSLAYVNAVGELAEAAGHHPDIDIRWNRVTLHLSTHDAGGLTNLDLALARQIDELDNQA